MCVLGLRLMGRDGARVVAEASGVSVCVGGLWACVGQESGLLQRRTGFSIRRWRRHSKTNTHSFTQTHTQSHSLILTRLFIRWGSGIRPLELVWRGCRWSRTFDWSCLALWLHHKASYCVCVCFRVIRTQRSAVCSVPAGSFSSADLSNWMKKTAQTQRREVRDGRV